MNGNGYTLEIHAREKINAPETWTLCKWECLPFGEETKLFKLRGVIEGKYKNGRRKCLTPHREVWITPEEHEAWLTAWEKRTGICSECLGKKEVLASWNATTGSTMRPCGRCGGTGAAPKVSA